MDGGLLKASVEGDVTYLHNRLRHDQTLLYRFLLPQARLRTPLHVACLAGKADYASELTRLMPELANTRDEYGMHPIHLAAALGHWNIVSSMLTADRSLGLVPDGEGRKIVHIAAACNRVEFLNSMWRGFGELLEARTVVEAETALHTSARHGQLDTVMALARNLPHIVNFTDRDGNTALHVAKETGNRVIENHLLTTTEINVNIRNTHGFTAREIDPPVGMEASSDPTSFLEVEGIGEEEAYLQQMATGKRWFKDMEKSILVVATVIADTTFTAGIRHRRKNGAFRFCVTSSFGLSLALFLLLASGGSLKQWVQVRIVLIILWASLFFMALAYSASVWHKEGGHVSKVATAFTIVVVLVMLLALLGHVSVLAAHLRDKRKWSKKSKEEYGNQSAAVLGDTAAVAVLSRDPNGIAMIGKD